RIAGVTNSCPVQGFRAFPLPGAAVDPSGRIWATWHDCEAAGGSRNAVFVATSSDGLTWSAPTMVTRGRNAVLPAIGIDPAPGRVAIAVMRSGALGMDEELVESPGSPTSWRTPKRLSAQSMPFEWLPSTTSGRMLGDYISVDYAGGRPLVVWVLASEPVAGRF